MPGFRWLCKKCGLPAIMWRLPGAYTGRLNSVLCWCAGGVVVSFFEWVQNLQNLR
jgi:hypothetical protein